MEGEIERLRKEQERTNEILEKLEQNGTLAKFLESVETEIPEWDKDPFVHLDPWDYNVIKERRNEVIADTCRTIHDEMKIAKYALGILDMLYKQRIEDLEKYRQYLNDNPSLKGDWRTYYANPKCQDFMEQYEKDHEISDSIFKEATKGGKNGGNKVCGEGKIQGYSPT